MLFRSWPEMLRAIQEIEPTYIVGENVRGLTNWNGGVVFEEVCADLEACGYEVQPILLPACAIGAPHRRDRIWFIATNTSSIRFCNNSSEQQFQSATFGTQQRMGEEQGTSTNTNNIRLQYTEKRRNILKSKRETPEKRCEFTKSFKANGGHGNASNTNGSRLERKFQKKKRKHTINRNTWRIFPTQSPICGGDDGLPTELDGITFSKWRAESIKGYGNAIVPQVAYEIFKVIAEMDRLEKLQLKLF